MLTAPDLNRVTNRLAWLLLMGIALGLGLSAAGLFDPRPAGPPRRTFAPLTLPTTGEPAVVWLAAAHAPFSVRAAFAAADTPYALVIADAASALYVGVDPYGYLALWQLRDLQRVTLVDWQPWVHLAPAAPAEIWLDVDRHALTLRLNRERFAFDVRDARPICRPCRIGIWSAGGSDVTVQQLTIFAPDPLVPAE